ncbi:pitrilysin family protein [Paenibacillus chitinolyticus]|uniref:EF-P 5-aminopentanol modification-associated protein YfmF n=1 Tax=Paenibacillus chitinolyticus TaxID=79263 RepID=UPI002DBCA485|nr:pitrilysin family protein [Paenibacillus chitinolyticus]MEC0246148.1 pitrilysin family protein [Paenibacillus chitinolyticus]
MSTQQFERSTLRQIRLHVLPTDRYKTFAISAYIGRPLSEEDVTQTALVPFVLRRGTESYPETKQFREHLDDLYGAGFGFDIYKRGDYQIVQFRMDVINDRFVSSPESLLEKALSFLGEAITKPAAEGDAFLSKYVESEKETLRKRIESIINDKIRFAAERCIAEMCKGEPYRLHPLGELKDIPASTPESLFAYFKKWLAEAPIDLYVVGNTTLQEVENIVSRSFRLEREENPVYTRTAPQRRTGETNVVVERFPVTQGKLNMGLRTPVTYGDDAYPAALMYNGILGGYPHSKLFLNVRERASLAYYASSRLDGHKGILTIQSGIEMQNYEKAVDIIRKQLEDMRTGFISDIELSQTRAMIANQLREMQDSAFEQIAFDFNAVLSGKERTVQELIDGVTNTNIAEIQQAAEGVFLDTIYFLRDEKEEAK